MAVGADVGGTELGACVGGLVVAADCGLVVEAATILAASTGEVDCSIAVVPVGPVTGAMVLAGAAVGVACEAGATV